MLRRPSSASNLVFTRFIRSLSSVVLEMCSTKIPKPIIREDESLKYPDAQNGRGLVAPIFVSPRTDTDHGSRAENVDDPAG